jgi:ATP-binding cassette subfamily B protein
LTTYKNPDYLFFDEATNSLDSINEQKIVTALEDIFKNKTVIIISHRFSTVRHADRIIVLDKGKVIEQGSHEELLSLSGRYASSFRLQAEGYILQKSI